MEREKEMIVISQPFFGGVTGREQMAGRRTKGLPPKAIARPACAAFSVLPLNLPCIPCKINEIMHLGGYFNE
uniref:hypothetical protein n=1 Tax=Dialister sp. TaxID=1955814 RepID=UPI00402874BC